MNQRPSGYEPEYFFGLTFKLMLCIVLYMINKKYIFGKYIRDKREKLLKGDKKFSLRQVSQRIGIEPSYLSKIERGQEVSLSEEKIILLSIELNEDPDVLLALSGKVSSDIQEIIRKRPQLFAQLIRELKDLPDHAVLRIVREVSKRYNDEANG